MQRADSVRGDEGDAPRVWPAVVLLVVLLALLSLPALLAERTLTTRVALALGPQVVVALILVWWLFLSRIPIPERLLGLGGIIVILTLTLAVADASLTQGFGVIGSVIPWGMTAFVVGFVTTHRLRDRRRTGAALLVALAGFGFWTLVRSEGVWGDFSSEYHWRWESRPEERILTALSRRGRRTVVPHAAGAPVSEVEAEWPGFRGAGRDATLPGVALAEDWSAEPPRLRWRIPVGPGWSSFAVAGERLFTQEQRGDDEVVVCYDAATGAERWVHAYPSRFWEAQGGVGPRATPTLSRGRLFTLGAEGLLHRLDPATGERVWQADLRADAGRQPPTWGFSSSPLVVDDLVIVHAGGEGGRGVLAYGADRGELRWQAAAGGHSYSSPQLLTVAGVPAIVMVTDSGLSLMDPADGSVLSRYEQSSEYRILQPLLVDELSLLMSSRFDGTSRLDLGREDGQLIARERWTSRSMKSDFSDYVAHEGYLYGFDVSIFACIDMDTGERQWKGGRYGHGQVLLLPDAGQLLVTTETGELVLVRADPERLTEVARLEVLEGKTWNHPALAGTGLYLRNSEEAVALELPILR